MALLLCLLFFLPMLVGQMRTADAWFSDGFEPYLKYAKLPWLTHELEVCRVIIAQGLRVDGTLAFMSEQLYGKGHELAKAISCLEHKDHEVTGVHCCDCVKRPSLVGCGPVANVIWCVSFNAEGVGGSVGNQTSKVVFFIYFFRCT